MKTPIKENYDEGLCPDCGEDIPKVAVEEETPAATAHLRSDGWVGECCWDERLRD
jgi:hypothetical protein